MDPSEYDGEWADIDDFSTDLLDSNVSCSPNRGPLARVRAAGPPGPLSQDGEGGLGVVSPLPQIPQSHQPG